MTKSINQNLQPAQSLSFNGGDENITEAHFSKSMKTERPKIVAANGPAALPAVHLFSDKEATKKMQSINTDIYEGAKKEKSNHEFNRKLYFKIFGGVALTAAGIAGFSKIRKWWGGKK